MDARRSWMRGVAFPSAFPSALNPSGRSSTVPCAKASSGGGGSAPYQKCVLSQRVTPDEEDEAHDEEDDPQRELLLVSGLLPEDAVPDKVTAFTVRREGAVTRLAADKVGVLAERGAIVGALDVAAGHRRPGRQGGDRRLAGQLDVLQLFRNLPEQKLVVAEAAARQRGRRGRSIVAAARGTAEALWAREQAALLIRERERRAVQPVDVLAQVEPGQRRHHPAKLGAERLVVVLAGGAGWARRGHRARGPRRRRREGGRRRRRAGLQPGKLARARLAAGRREEPADGPANSFARDRPAVLEAGGGAVLGEQLGVVHAGRRGRREGGPRRKARGGAQVVAAVAGRGARLDRLGADLRAQAEGLCEAAAHLVGAEQPLEDLLLVDALERRGRGSRRGRRRWRRWRRPRRIVRGRGRRRRWQRR